MTTSSDTELIRRLEHALTLLECATSGGPPDLIPRPSTLLAEARARLAQSEPEEVTDEELLRTYGKAKREHCYDGPIDDWPRREERAATVHGLRAVIAADRARYAHPTIKPVPERVTNAQIDELADEYLDGDRASTRDFARALLANCAHPTIKPVPVAERPWEWEGWCDAEGMCWFGTPKKYPADAGWILREPEELLARHAVSLPHHALPIPTTH